MPYENASDPKLPARIRKMSLAKRRRWVSTWNSVFNQHKDEGRAFAAANAAVSEDKKELEAEEILSYSKKDLSKHL